MSVTITVPDDVAKAAQEEADANGATLEQYLVATLTERFGTGEQTHTAVRQADYRQSPLYRLIGIAKDGPSDSSEFHDYRPGDPV